MVIPEANPFTALIDEGGIWHVTLFFGLSAILVKWISRWKDHRIDGLEISLWCYVLLYSLYIVEYPSYTFGFYTRAFQWTAAQVFIEALLIPVGAILLHGWIKLLLPFVVLFSLAATWFHFDGLFIAPSFNTAFSALAIPLMPPWIIGVTFITAIMHHGNTALLIMLFQGIPYAIKYRKFVGYYSVLMVMAGVSAYINHPGPLLGGEERIYYYKHWLEYWSHDLTRMMLGVGPGSFQWISLLQADFKGEGIFLAMHSDWLQILWELGLVGLTLTLGVVGVSLKRAWGNPAKLSMILGAVAFGVTYHPLRFFPSALLTAYYFLVVIKTHVQDSGANRRASRVTRPNRYARAISDIKWIVSRARSAYARKKLRDYNLASFRVSRSAREGNADLNSGTRSIEN